MILDQSINMEQLGIYLYYLCWRNEIIEDTLENQTFWKDIEYNFVQTYLEETDISYTFVIPL